MDESQAAKIKTHFKTKTDKSLTFAQSKIFKELNNINSNTAEKLRNHIKDGESVYTRGSYDETFLHVLCTPVSKELTNYLMPLVFVLVEAGVDVNSKDKEGNTPLHVCAINELDDRICEAFLRLGGDPEAVNSYDQTPLELTENTALKDLMQYYKPGISNAIDKNNFDDIKRLTSAWCIPDQRDLEEVADKTEDDTFDARICEHFEQSQTRLTLIANALSGNHEAVRKKLKDYDGVKKEIIDGYQFEKFGRKWPLLAEVVRLQLWECAKALIKITDTSQVIDTPEEDSVPLCLWILQSHYQPSIPFLKALLKKCKIQNYDCVTIIYNMWKKEHSLSEVLECFTKAGYVLSARDSEGLTIRDLILRDLYKDESSTLKKTLYEVDQYVIKLATEGKVSELNTLLVEGYDYLIVEDLKRKAIQDKAAKKKQTSSVEFLKNVPQHQALIKEVHKAVVVGNFQRLKHTLDDKLATSRDRGGRSLLHKAILYERIYIIKYLLKTYPDIVSITDNVGRTPLHYAVCLIDVDDIEDQLISLGADETEPDKHGYSALDYKTSVDATDVMKAERDKQYGGNVYLLHHYFILSDAIQSGDIELLSMAIANRGGMELDELNGIPSTFGVPKFRPLLFQCVESKQGDMALALVDAGADCNIAAKIPKKDGSIQLLTLIQAAEMHGLNDLAIALREKMAREDEKMRRNMAFKNVVNRMQVTQALKGDRNVARLFAISKSQPPAKRQNYENEEENMELSAKKESQIKEEKTNQESSTCIIS